MTPKHVLIVDDEKEIRDILVNVLSTLENFKMTVASNGEEALEILKSGIVDVILTDLAMPKMNGFEFLRRLKITGKSIPTIVLTGHGDRTVLAQLRNYGVSTFLNKPWDNQNLLDTVLQMAERGSSGKAA